MLHITPINELECILESTWTPTNWPAMRKLINPMDDPFVAKCQLLRFNLQRAIHIRSEAVRKYFWAQLSILDEARIEAEHDALVEMYEQVKFIEREWMIEKYLDSDMDALENRKGPFFRAEVDLGALPAPYDSTLPYEFDGMSHMFPPGHPVRLEYNQAVQNQAVPATPVPKQSFTWLRLHLDKIGPLHHAITQSHQHLLFELWQAGVDSNALSGAGAKLRALLTNADVPIPNDYTFLSWWNHAGWAFSEIVDPNLRALWSRMCEFTPTHIMSFIIPCMPMSREHRSGHQLLGDDSHADHSLSWKSAAHNRDHHGRLLHGIWEHTTVLLDASGDDSGDARTYLVANERIKNGNATGIGLVLQHSAMLPRLKYDSLRFYKNVFMGGKDYQLKELFGVVNDPYLTYPQPLTFHRIEPGLSFDVGFRSMSKFHRTHFRFDDDEVGALAATEWRNAFINCAIRYARRSIADHARVHFESALIRQGAVRRGNKARTQFNLSEFDSE